MTKKLYVVEVTDELPVYAESEADAKAIARGVLTGFDYDRFDLAASAVVSEWGSRIGNYPPETLPWGEIMTEDGHELTIGEITDA